MKDYQPFIKKISSGIKKFLSVRNYSSFDKQVESAYLLARKEKDFDDAFEDIKSKFAGKKLNFNQSEFDAEEKDYFGSNPDVEMSDEISRLRDVKEMYEDFVLFWNDWGINDRRVRDLSSSLDALSKYYGDDLHFQEQFVKPMQIAYTVFMAELNYNETKTLITANCVLKLLEEQEFQAVVSTPDGKTIDSTAKKWGGVWLIGGDKIATWPAGSKFSIRMKDKETGRWAWFKLQGQYLIFSDFTGED